MNATLEVVSLVAEVLSWVTLPLGIVMLVFGYLRRALSPDWMASPAALVEVEASIEGIHAAQSDPPSLEAALPEGTAKALVLRWFASDGQMHESVLDRRLFSDVHPDDELTVYHDPARPELVRLSRPPRKGKHVVHLGWLLTGAGVVSFLLTFLVLFD